MTSDSTFPSVPSTCGFCGQAVSEAEEALVGYGVLICVDCLSRAHALQRSTAGPRVPADPDEETDPKALLADLGHIISTRNQADRMMREHVDLLRTHRVSWARIAQVFGVSRQAAWERFYRPPSSEET